MAECPGSHAWAERCQMPIFRYFVCVGGALLALLFAANVVFPKAPPAEAILTAGSDMPPIRIRSDRKLPERVVLDTSQPTIVPPPVQTAAIAAPQPAGSKVRETFAQMVPTAPKADAAAPRRAEAKAPPRRRIARSRPYYYAPPAKPMLVAQQPHFGLFNMTW